MISALPDIKVLTLTDDHEFMVIACDGIWNVMSSQEVIDFIQSKISQRDENGELRLLSSIVEEVSPRVELKGYLVCQPRFCLLT